MTRRRLHLVIALMLPLLALRAFLPAGYMAEVVQGELRMVMCGDGLQAPDQTSHGDGGASSMDGGTCAFAQATFHAPPPHLVASVIAGPTTWTVTPGGATGLPPAAGPPRHNAARAPPTFS